MLTPFARDTLTITVQLAGNWTGWTPKGDIRAARDHLSTLIKSFSWDSSGAATGLFVASITAANMQTIAPNVDYWFDLRATSGAVQITWVQDQIRLVENATP